MDRSAHSSPPSGSSDDLWQQIAGKCRHFNGIQHKNCRIGVSYEQFPVASLPCLGHNPSLCVSMSPVTEGEARQRVEELRAGARDYLSKLGANVCPTHNIPIVMEKVGRSVYLRPCGCRVGQGTVEGIRRAGQAFGSLRKEEKDDQR